MSSHLPLIFWPALTSALLGSVVALGSVPATPLGPQQPSSQQPSNQQPSGPAPALQPSSSQPLNLSPVTATPFIGPLLPPLLPPELEPLIPLPSLPPALPVPDITPGQSPPVVPGPAVLGEVRGLWVDAFGPGLKTPAQVSQMVKDASSLGVNTLFVQTIRRADCLCNLASVPRATDSDLAPDFDPLADAIKLAHAKNIRVFAWVSVTGAGNAAVPSKSPQQILRMHGADAGKASWVNRRPDGSYLQGSDVWLDAGIPQAAEFMTDEILSVVRNYDIDGIQLDRIRYPDGGNWGYSPVTLSRYHSETGAIGMPSPTDPAWIDWKRQQITALVRRITLETRLIKPNVWISAATITYGAPPADLAGFQKSRTYADVLQDWPGWSQEGLLDLNVLMNYKQDLLPNHIAWFDDWNKFALSVRGKADVAAGTALYLNSPDVSRRQMQRALAAGLGWVGYAYRTPGVDVYKNGQSQPVGFSKLRQTLTGTGGPLIPTLWQAAPPARYALFGRVVGSSSLGGKTVEARSATGSLLAKTLTDGNGYYGFTDLPQGAVDVRVGGQHWLGQLNAPGVVRYPDMLLRGVKIVPAMHKQP